MQYDLICRLREIVEALESQLASFATELATVEIRQAKVFELPAVLKGEELEEIDAIPVTQVKGSDAVNLAISHYSRLFMQQQPETISTRSATRLPGILCVSGDQQGLNTFQKNISQINQTKLALEQLITKESGLKAEARFPFVHQHCPGLITLNAYRQIPYFSLPDSVNFGWANKHFIKRTSKTEVLNLLQKSLNSGRAKAPWTKMQWAELVQAELDTIQALPEDVVLKFKRPIKVQPIVRLWYADKQKQQQFACPSPILVGCEKGQSVPTIGELNNYCQQQITHRHRPKALPLQLVIPRLWLWQQH